MDNPIFKDVNEITDLWDRLEKALIEKYPYFTWTGHSDLEIGIARYGGKPRLCCRFQGRNTPITDCSLQMRINLVPKADLLRLALVGVQHDLTVTAPQAKRILADVLDAVK